MNCPNCGAEVPEKAKFCVKCGEPLRREIEIAPIWKWGSMIASFVLIFIFGIICIEVSVLWHPSIPPILIILLTFGFLATFYLMYKERTKKIKYGLLWVAFPIILLLYLDNSVYELPSSFSWAFLGLPLPAILIDFVYVLLSKIG